MRKLRTLGMILIVLGWLLFAAMAFLRADNLSDLRDAHADGLPFAACWNVNNFPFAWHVDQLRAGRRLLPSIRLPGVYDDVGKEIIVATKQVDTLDPHWNYLRENRLPVCLRFNNIAAIFPARPRLPLVPESIPQSPLVWRILRDGKLDDTPFADPWGPVELWTEEGKRLGSSGYVQAIARKLPDPAWVCLAENHEGSELTYENFINTKHDRLLDGTWKSRYWWKTREEIAAISVRMAEQFDGANKADAWSLYPPYSRRYNGNYGALFGAFRSSLPPAWGERLYVEQYSAGDGMSPPASVREKLGPNPQAACADGWGQSVYLNWYQTPGDLTEARLYTHSVSSIPAWEFHRGKNPRAYRVIYVSANGASAQFGVKAGKHEVITPERWQALCEWLLWLNRENAGKPVPARAVPVCLRWWIGARARPTDLFFPGTTDTTLAKITHGDYVVATARACDRICEQPTFRNHWLRGETIPLPAPKEPTQVWLSATRIGEETLLYAWTPCLIEKPVTVSVPGAGEVTIAFAGRPSVYMVRQPAWREVE